MRTQTLSPHLDVTHLDLDYTEELTEQEIRCSKVLSLNDSQN